MNRNYKILINDIIAAMDHIVKFVEGMNYQEFIADEKTISAVFRKFEVIGEAIKLIPEHIRIGYPEVPWKRMAGMRDKLIHGYFTVDYKLVWNSIKIEIPKLKPEFQNIFNDFDTRSRQKDKHLDTGSH